MSVSERHKSARREKVLLAARKCFIRRGFHATGMAEIAKACRMSAGNIYHYFPSKEAIVCAITNETRSRVFPALRRFENHPDPVAAVIQIVLLGVREACRDGDARLWMEISAEAPRNKLIRDTFSALDRDIRDVLVTLLQRAVRAGKVPGDLDLEATALWLVALQDGAISRVSFEPDIDLDKALVSLERTLRCCLSAQPN